MNQIVEFVKVSHKYGTYHVLEDVSFTLAKGAVTTLIGPNGAGKTTIAKLLLNLESPSSGHVRNLAKKLAYVPQKLTINPELPLNVEKFLGLISPQYKGNEMSELLLNFANMHLLMKEPITNLSGGQLQRVMLSAAILNSPELLVLDEPTQGLDIEAQEEFYSIIERVKQLSSMSIFIISHDLFTVMKKSDEVLCLNHHLCCRGRPTHTVVKGVKNIGIYAHVHDHIHE